MTLVTRQLRSPEELERFCAGYAAAYEGRRLRMLHPPRPEELRGWDHVFGVFLAGELVAGFVVNRYPHRCFAGLDPVRRGNCERERGGRGNLSELAAIWKSPRLDSARFRLLVWPRIVWRTLRHGRGYIFGCVYSGHGMRRSYLLLGPRVVHEGAGENDLTVFCHTRGTLLATLLVGILAAATGAIRKGIARWMLFGRGTPAAGLP